MVGSVGPPLSTVGSMKLDLGHNASSESVGSHWDGDKLAKDSIFLTVVPRDMILSTTFHQNTMQVKPKSLSKSC